MKISLINPNPHIMGAVNIGLAHLISYLEKSHEIQLIDTTFQTNGILNKVRSSLQAFQPELIGFSTFSYNHWFSLKIASHIRKFFKNIPFIWGGIHCTLFPHEVISHPLVDAICIGDGEISFSGYLDCLSNNSTKEVPGIWLKEKSGTIRRNSLSPRISLHNLPLLNYKGWEIDKYMMVEGFVDGSLSFLSSRGCPYNCSFCVNESLSKATPGQYFRNRPINDVIKEITECRKLYNFRVVHFADEVFGLDMSHFKNFLGKYHLSSCRDIPWSAQTRPDLISEEYAKIAKETGCVFISLGIETGDEHRRQELFQKRISDLKINDAIHSLEKYKILYKFNMILGGPGETSATLKKTFVMIRQHDPVFVMATPFYNLPGSRIYKDETNFAPASAFKMQLLLNKITSVYKYFIESFRMRKWKFLKDLLKILLNIGFYKKGIKNWNFMLFLILRKTYMEYKFQDKIKK